MNTEEEKIILYVVFAVLFIISIILISGHAPWLVAGYNTATKKEKENIDEFRETIYKKVRELHVQKYPYNDFLYEVE